MESEALERVINRGISALLVAMLMIFAYVVKDSLPWVTGVMGTVFGSLTGAAVATRTAKQTRAKVAQESERPPPNDNDDASGTTVVNLSEQPPAMPRRDPPRSLAIALGFAAGVLVACATGTPNVAAGVYGAERSLCVERHDAAAEARECMRAVDERYGQDGGLHAP